MNTFSTRTEAVNYMVSKNVPRNLARAVVNEQYNYEANDDTSDRLWEMNDNGPVVVTVTEQDVFQTWQTFEGMLSDDDKGIYIDGELLYKVNGDHVSDGIRVSG